MRVSVTDHAVERYQERVRPGVSLAQAKRELIALTKSCPVSEKFPAWAQDKDFEADAMLLISDGVALVLRREARQFVAATCVVRGMMPTFQRERRNHRKAVLRAARRHRKYRRGKRPEEEWT